jgi:hypothetical protein
MHPRLGTVSWPCTAINGLKSLPVDLAKGEGSFDRESVSTSVNGMEYLTFASTRLRRESLTSFEQSSL